MEKKKKHKNPTQKMMVMEFMKFYKQASISDISKALDLPAPAVATAASRLVHSGELQKLGRGEFRAKEHYIVLSHYMHFKKEVHVKNELVSLLEELDLPGQLSGYDILGDYTNQLMTSWPHLLITPKGAGEWVSDSLREKGYASLVNPPASQVQAASDIADNNFIIIRERSIKGDKHIRSLEEAWVDLLAEQRESFPVTNDDLSDILENFVTMNISWTKLARTAQRRNLPIVFSSESSPIPLTVGKASPSVEKRLRQVLSHA